MFSMNAIGYAIGFGIAVLIPILCHYAAKMWPSAHVDLPGQSNQQIQENRKRQSEEYCRHLFYACSVLGIGSLVIGSYLPVQALSSGFMFGGTFSIMQGVGFNWRDLQPGLKFSVLLVAIVVLTIGGYARLAH